MGQIPSEQEKDPNFLFQRCNETVKSQCRLMSAQRGHMALRVMVYSHDTFGLGNIRRMLLVSEHLLKSISDVSVLVVTGSPVVHEFRLRPGLDYIKLPCLSRAGSEEYAAKTLGTEIGQLIQLRAGLVLSAARDFAPDVVLIDKKPDGVKHELRPTLDYLAQFSPQCKIALVLRDILDAPDVTTRTWGDGRYEQTLRRFFHSILVLGDPNVFDAAREYGFSSALRRMVEYCGYARRATPADSEWRGLRERWLDGFERVVFVTAGGGEDGGNLVRSYLAGAAALPGVRSVIVCGPEMPLAEREQIQTAAHDNPAAVVLEFSGKMMALMAASDVVVSMAGFNTVCEILSLGKRAVVVPRVRPVQEQWIRAQRLAELGAVRVIHPDMLTPETLAAEVGRELQQSAVAPPFRGDLGGLDRIANWVQRMTPKDKQEVEDEGRLAWHAPVTY